MLLTSTITKSSKFQKVIYKLKIVDEVPLIFVELNQSAVEYIKRD